MYKLGLLLLLFNLSFFSVNCQERFLKKGDSHFKNLEYSLAVQRYLKAYNKGYDVPDIYSKLGDSYYYMTKLSEAHKWYQKLYETNEKKSPEFYFRYAQTLKFIGKNEEAKDVLKFFKDTGHEDNRLNALLKEPNFNDSIRTQTSLYNIKNMDINSPQSDYGGAQIDSLIVFTSARGANKASKNINKWTGDSFFDLYATNKEKSNGEVVNFSSEINTKYHESSAIFTADSKTMYFTRSNYINKKTRKDKKGVVRLKIFKATLIDEKWTNVEELPFNDNSYETAHPALSPDEKRLYFASDRPGGYGMSDIYYVDINDDGTYSEVINAGEKINTERRETFPFIGEGNSLYFASDGHPGLGGLDIFVSKPNFSGYEDAVNIGMPVNSGADDFSFVIDEKIKTGYFASNRDGGRGDDDLYVFQIDEAFKIECKKLITGLATDIETNELLTNVAVDLIAEDETKLQKIVTDDTGTFNFFVDCEDDKKNLTGTKVGYLTAKEGIPYTGRRSDTININLALIKELQTPVGGYDLAKLIRINPVYFGFDKYNIDSKYKSELDKIIQTLQENQGISLDIKAHTDSRGSSTYNEILSEKRAKSTLNYLVKQGVSAKRMSGKGYGETQLVNECKDGLNCTREEHQKNRRSEFIIKNEIIYTVQVGAFYGEPDLVSLETADDLYSYDYEDGFIRFYSGIFTTKEEAEARKKELKANGFEKPFIRVLQNDGNIISEINL